MPLLHCKPINANATGNFFPFGCLWCCSIWCKWCCCYWLCCSHFDLNIFRNYLDSNPYSFECIAYMQLRCRVMSVCWRRHETVSSVHRIHLKKRKFPVFRPFVLTDMIATILCGAFIFTLSFVILFDSIVISFLYDKDDSTFESILRTCTLLVKHHVVHTYSFLNVVQSTNLFFWCQTPKLNIRWSILRFRFKCNGTFVSLFNTIVTKLLAIL